MDTDNNFTTIPLTRLLEQQRFVRQLCECGELSIVYADDAVTPLCGTHWWDIYGSDADADL